jgi:hypothetical protein
MLIAEMRHVNCRHSKVPIPFFRQLPRLATTTKLLVSRIAGEVGTSTHMDGLGVNQDLSELHSTSDGFWRT